MQLGISAHHFYHNKDRTHFLIINSLLRNERKDQEKIQQIIVKCKSSISSTHVGLFFSLQMKNKEAILGEDKDDVDEILRYIINPALIVNICFLRILAI